MRRSEAATAARARRFSVIALVVTLLMTLAGFAHGDATSRMTKPVPHLVSAKVAGDPTSVAAVLAVLRERVGGRPEDASFEVVAAIDRASIITPPRNATNDAQQRAQEQQQLARIWVDLTEPPVTLYVVDGSWERVLVRPIARQSNPEVMWEEIGHIVELALGSLRAGESIGVARAELMPGDRRGGRTPPVSIDRRSESPGPQPTALQPRRWSVRGGGYYATSAYGSGLEMASGPGALVELHAHPSRKLELGGVIMGEYRFPSSVDRGSAVVRFEGAAVHALASGAFSLAPRHQLLFGIGGGVDLVHARAFSASPNLDNVRFEDGKLDPIPAARVLARYGFATPSLRLFAGVGLDVPLRNPRYLLGRPDDVTVVLFEPWAIRPFLLMGIETN